MTEDLNGSKNSSDQYYVRNVIPSGIKNKNRWSHFDHLFS